jgi:putative PIG3 family NAD(P)H quinone oxidoreductase
MAENTVAAEMLAIEISEPGPPEALRPARRPVPEPGPEEVLIAVAAAGVNRPDCLQRRGLYPPPPGASDIPGLEVSGTVVATGSKVSEIHQGTRVCALLSGGGYAEYCTAPAVQCLPVPGGLTWTQAAALPETFFTVWTNLFQRGGLTARDTVLIHGGASGIGTTAIQLARAFGARVFATVGSEEKQALCERLGAEKAINYHQQNFVDVIHALTDEHGVDLILDIVGAAYFDGNLKVLSTDGRLVIIGVLGGSRVDLNLRQLLTKRLMITASTLRARSPAFKGRVAAALRKNVWPLLESGTIAPVIQKTFPLQEAAKAHTLLEANQAMGKLVLLVNDDK